MSLLRTIARRSTNMATAMRGIHTARVMSNADGLRSILREELQIEKEEGTAPTFQPEIRGFKVEYNPGNPVLNLTNVVDGDLVNIRININDCEVPEAPVWEEEAENDVVDDIAPRPAFAINITNEAKGKTLLLNAFVEEDNLVITRMAIKPTGVEPEKEYEQVYFTDFQNLDERVQEQTANYLATKGIGVEMCQEISGLVADAEYSEYLGWLNETAEFLE